MTLDAVPRPFRPAVAASSVRPEANPPETPLDVVLSCLDDMKAEDIVTIDLAGKTSLADHMVIASGRSQRHVGSLAEKIASEFRERGLPKPRIEGLPHCDWVLIDAGDAIVHLFRPEVRGFYNLEKMWGADRPADEGGRRQG